MNNLPPNKEDFYVIFHLRERPYFPPNAINIIVIRGRGSEFTTNRNLVYIIHNQNGSVIRCFLWAQSDLYVIEIRRLQERGSEFTADLNSLEELLS